MEDRNERISHFDRISDSRLPQQSGRRKGWWTSNKGRADLRGSEQGIMLEKEEVNRIISVTCFLLIISEDQKYYNNIESNNGIVE